MILALREKRISFIRRDNKMADRVVDRNVYRINQGSVPDLSEPEGDSAFFFVQADDPETAVPRIIELVKTRTPQRFGLDPI